MASTSSTSASLPDSADYQFSADYQTLFDEQSIESIVTSIKTTRETKLANILCSYLKKKRYDAASIDERLFQSFFGCKDQPSAIFEAFGSDLMDTSYRYQRHYSNANTKRSSQCPTVAFETFSELFENRGQAGYRNIYSAIKRSAFFILHFLSPGCICYANL